MRALTLHQPHAHLLATGMKVLEVRTWINPYRGMMLIHAGKTYDDNLKVISPAEGRNVFGAIIGYCYLTDIFRFKSFSHFEEFKMYHMNIPLDEYWNPDERQYGWNVKAAYLFPEPIPARGWPKLWIPTPDLKQKIIKQMKGTDK